ncbi:hypothetical protein [Nocardioides sp. 616]|uniref:hypothetical protein n=1 Tax=Nocardioides sp. 616 TaxID=2268090 RepID=UPI0013B418F3|nr:hypothetical protein [Nocardioides sp. 616]
MNTEELTSMLRTLPPAMHGSADRFEVVAQRARRRARAKNAALAGVSSAAAIAAAAVLAGGTPTKQPDSLNIATDPASPTASVGYDQSKPLPGVPTAVELGEPVVVTATGSSTVNLGPRPDGATAVNVSLACLTAGRIKYPDGASIKCDGPAPDDQIIDPTSSNHALLALAPGQTSLTFQAPEGVGWKVVAIYVRTEMSEWGVNAKGETFGVQRNGRSPDLIAVVTTDGKQGYAYVEDLEGPVPTSPADALAQQEANEGKKRSVPVYESDGETLIGEYVSG